MSPFVVKFLVRPGCHLCDDARPVVAAEVGRAGGMVIEIDIESDDSLLKEYGLRIPVALGPDGSVLAEGIINRGHLRDAFKKIG